MLKKLKNQFILTNYELELLKRLQNLRKKERSMKEYTKGFYNMIIRTIHIKASKEKVARYLNGPRINIQEELSSMKMTIVEEAYQFILKVEQKLKNMIEQR